MCVHRYTYTQIFIILYILTCDVVVADTKKNNMQHPSRYSYRYRKMTLVQFVLCMSYSRNIYYLYIRTI